MAGTAAHLLADHDEGGCILGRHQALSAAERHVHRIQLAQGRAAGRHTPSARLRLGQNVICGILGATQTKALDVCI